MSNFRIGDSVASSLQITTARDDTLSTSLAVDSHTIGIGAVTSRTKTITADRDILSTLINVNISSPSTVAQYWYPILGRTHIITNDDGADYDVDIVAEQASNTSLKITIYFTNRLGGSTANVPAHTLSIKIDYISFPWDV